MGTLVHFSNASVLDIPHFRNKIAAPEQFIKKGEVSSQFWEVKVLAQQQLDNGEDFMSSLRQDSVGEECSHAEIGGQRVRVQGELADFFSTLLLPPARLHPLKVPLPLSIATLDSNT